MISVIMLTKESLEFSENISTEGKIEGKSTKNDDYVNVDNSVEFGDSDIGLRKECRKLSKN